MDIQQFYTGKNIMLTGTTGFVGKVILEKILRSLPGSGRIYIMVRGKKKTKPVERVKKIFKSFCFNRLQKMFADTSEFDEFIS